MLVLYLNKAIFKQIMMLGFYQFLIWFFTIVSLIALIYGVLEAEITYIGLFIGFLIISLVFYKLNETPSEKSDNKSQIKDLSLQGFDHQNEEVLTAIESLRQEQTKLLAELKSKVYMSQDFPNLKQIKTEILKDFIKTLTIKYEFITKQELQDLLSNLFNDLERKNITFLFDPNFFPNDTNFYIDWTKRSLVFLGWNLRKVDNSLESFFSGVFEKNGLIIGLTITTDLKTENVSLKQHEHFIATRSIDFSVFVTPSVRNDIREFFSSKDKIFILEHKDLINLASKLVKTV